MEKSLPSAAGGAASGRLVMVDALRGYALLGLFLVHMNELFELYWAVQPPPSAIHDAVFAVFAGKAYALFALCFGFSLFVMMETGAQRGQDMTRRMIWRLTLLFGFGLLHGLLYRGDIIMVLAPLGLALLALNRIRSLAVLWAAAGFFLIQPLLLARIAAALAGQDWAAAQPLFWTDPAMETYLHGSLGEVLAVNLWAGQSVKWLFMLETGRMSQILGLFVIGLILGRIGFFADDDRHARARRLALGLLLVSAVALKALKGVPVEALFGDRLGTGGWVWNAATAAWFDLACTLITALVFVEAWRLLRGRGLSLLAPTGRMSLTLYIGQSLVFVPVFYGFGLGGYATIGQTQAFLIGIAAFAAQIAFAALWFRRFTHGPLESVLRRLTGLRLPAG